MKTWLAIVAVLFILSAIDAAPRAKPTSRPARRAPKPAAKPKSNINQRSALVRPNPKLNGKTKRQFLELFNGGSVYPNYFVQHPSPFAPYQESFLQAAFLSGAQYSDLTAILKNTNATDANGKALPLDPKTSAAFEAAFGDKKEDKEGNNGAGEGNGVTANGATSNGATSNGASAANGGAKDAANIKAKIYAFDNLGNVNIINPFIAAKDADGKLLKGEAAIKAGKLGELNGKAIALINPFRGGNALDPVFGPEIAPRYIIHYTPQGYAVDGIATPLVGGSPLNLPAVGVSPIGLGGLNIPPVGLAGIEPFALGLPPSFNGALGPYPLPFIPGFDPKSLKPNGKKNGAKDHESTSTEQSAEGSTESFQESSSESSSEYSNSETSSEPSSESSSEAPQ